MNRLLLLTGLVLLLLPMPVWAHALGADWKIDGDKVVLEAYFSDGTPAQAAPVQLYGVNRPPFTVDESKPILEVKTDEKGVCSFPLPKPGNYKIVVDAGAGHRKELAMEIRTKPAPVPGIILAVGSACLGRIGNLSLFPILAADRTAAVAASRYDGPSKEEFTAYPWRSVIVGFGIIAGLALIVWLLRRGTTGANTGE